MGKLLSLSVSIPTIVVLFIGGLTIMIIPVNGILTAQWNPITSTLWVIAFILLIGVLIYRRQKVYIDTQSCRLRAESAELLTVKLQGFIRSRHPDGLMDLLLWLSPNISVSSSKETFISHTVNLNPQMFTVEFDVSSSFLSQAREILGQHEAIIDVVAVSAKMVSGHWLTDAFVIPIVSIESGQIKGQTMSGKITSRTHKQKKGLGVSNKQFHKLLEKAAQPIKKPESDSGKS